MAGGRGAYQARGSSCARTSRATHPVVITRTAIPVVRDRTAGMRSDCAWLRWRAWDLRSRRQGPISSTVLMSAIPARVAACPRILRPRRGRTRRWRPRDRGRRSCFRRRWAQAIAALAYGTPSDPRVDKIVGPGNAYVAAAKRLVFGGRRDRFDSRDRPRGSLSPTRLAEPRWVAAILLAQARHDELAGADPGGGGRTVADRVVEELSRSWPACRGGRSRSRPPRPRRRPGGR